MKKLFEKLVKGKSIFECPVCGYLGSFKNLPVPTGNRIFACCPKCGALERHRLQKLVFDAVTDSLDLSGYSMLHFAPEPVHRRMLSKVGHYVTADLEMQGVDYHFDLQHRAPFDTDQFDIVFASHVLEHISNDHQALEEIARITRPGGLAFLPVPILVEKTIEYPNPNPLEEYHVRAPGLDYFDRYDKLFSRVEQFNSNDFDKRFQLHIYEDRSIYPTDSCPWRTPTLGERHLDYVPVCYA